MRDVNKSLQFEVDDLKQKLNDANGDIKVPDIFYHSNDRNLHQLLAEI